MALNRLETHCWHCGEKLTDILLPFSRFEECPKCSKDLHTCKACKYYSASLTSSCNEERADFIVDKDKANFCDFFDPSPNPFKSSAAEKEADARAKLAALFGEASDDQPESAIKDKNLPVSEADKALAELKRLFGDD